MNKCGSALKSALGLFSLHGHVPTAVRFFILISFSLMPYYHLPTFYSQTLTQGFSSFFFLPFQFQFTSSQLPSHFVYLLILSPIALPIINDNQWMALQSFLESIV